MKICQGPRDIHYNVKCRPFSKWAIPLKSSTYEAHKGKINSYFQYLVDPKKNCESIRCWKQKDGELFCDGPATVTDIYISLPVLLLFEVLDQDDWDYPQQLSFKKSSSSGSVHLVYTLAARVLYDSNQGHYTARLRGLEGSQVYYYDDLASENRGFTQPIVGSTLRSHLSGPDSTISLPTGMRTCFAAYYLKGGTESQVEFLQYQTNLLKNDFYIDLSTTLQSIRRSSFFMDRPGATLVSHGDRFWISAANNNVPKTNDYIEELPGPKVKATKRKQGATPKGTKTSTRRISKEVTAQKADTGRKAKRKVDGKRQVQEPSAVEGKLLSLVLS